MKCLVIGNGNLGAAIYNNLKLRGHDTTMLSRSSGWEYNFASSVQVAGEFDYVFNCIGYGSIYECKENQKMAVKTYLDFPLKLKELFVDSKIITFSSDYVLEPQLSFYASIKLSGEVVSGGNTRVIRVSSLYGDHKPYACFVGKIIVNAVRNGALSIPINRVTPTPVNWLADKIINNLDSIFSKEIIHSIAPKNGITLFDWAKIIVQNRVDIVKKWYDVDRPFSSKMDCTFTEIVDSCIDLVKEDSSLYLKLWVEQRAIQSRPTYHSK